MINYIVCTCLITAIEAITATFAGVDAYGVINKGSVRPCKTTLAVTVAVPHVHLMQDVYSSQ